MAGLPVFIDRNLLNVRFPLSFGVTHRVADTVTTHWFFTTIIAFSHDDIPCLSFQQKAATFLLQPQCDIIPCSRRIGKLVFRGVNKHAG